MALTVSRVEELRASVTGPVFLPDDRECGSDIRFCPLCRLTTRPRFATHSTVFNGNVKTCAKAVFCPVNTEDVSK